MSINLVIDGNEMNKNLLIKVEDDDDDDDEVFSLALIIPVDLFNIIIQW